MKTLNTESLIQRVGIVLLSIVCSVMFLSTASEAKSWSRYHKDETCSYYYDSGNITYPAKKKKLFGWVIDKDVVGLWVKIIEKDKEPPAEVAEMLQQDENAVYVEVTCSKKDANLKDIVPKDAQKGRTTSRVMIPDEKIVKRIEAGASKDALVDVICKPE
jgi:hypothetical protein